MTDPTSPAAVPGTANVGNAADPVAGRPSRWRPSLALLAGVFLPLYALDQWTKWLTVRHIRLHDELPVIPGWFSLVHLTNTGAAWGMLAGRSTFFLVVATVALVVLAVLYRKGMFATPWAAAGLCLLLPGIVGNLTDRVARGAVVDFLSFDLHFPGASPFPAFNVADSCITLAVCCFLVGSWLDARAEGRQQAVGGGKVEGRR